ncbi:MAG: DinB family protein [Anaerolineales bacterium]|nr:DinB family protein [Anaerolineales bacterium]
MEFKTLYQELTKSTEMLKSLLAGISQEEAQVKQSPGKWSILEVICHLYDEEREDFREHLDFIISTSLNAGLRRQDEEWHPISPFAWVKLRKYNQQNFTKMRNKFFSEREKSLRWLKSLRKVDWEAEYKRRLGTMSAGDMFSAWVAHDNLHVRQLVELRRRYIERITKPYKIRYAGDW